MLLFSEKRPTIMIENPHDQILSLPIIIEDGESETDSDIEDFQPIIIIIPTSAAPVREQNEIEIEIIYEPANVQYIEVEHASDSNDSMPNGVEKMDISDDDDDDNFGEISDSMHSTRIPVQFSKDYSGSMPENERNAHTTVNADEAESSNSRYHTAYDHTH